MGKTKMSLGIVDEIHKSWNINKYIFYFFLSSMCVTLGVVWRILLAYPEVTEDLFWTIFGIIFWVYLSAGFGLLFKVQTTITDVVSTRLRDDHIRTRDVAESHLQWAAAKPDKIQDVIESFRNNEIWVSSNTQIALLEEIEKLHKKIDGQDKQIQKLSKKKKNKEIEVPAAA